MLYRAIAGRPPVGFTASMILALLASVSLASSGAAETITEIINSTAEGAVSTLSGPSGVAVDAAGNVYVATQVLNDNVFQITPSGVITEIIDATGDGAGNGLDRPVYGVAVDAAGSVYVTGLVSDNAFQITPSGVITEIIDATGDGAGNLLDSPRGIAVDAAGSVYVTGAFSHNAFQITPGGVITEIIDATGDGAGSILSIPHNVAVDTTSNVYVAGLFSDNVFQITPGGVITEIIDATGDGTGNVLDGARGVAVDAAGNVYVAGAFSDNAFQITPGGVITEIIDATGDGAGNTFSHAHSVAVDAASNVYVTGLTSNNAFQIAPAVTVACPASPAPSCVQATRAKLRYRERIVGREKMRMQWKRLGSDTTQRDFGTPVSRFTSVALCIYDDGGGLVRDFVVDRAHQLCAGEPCWREKGSKGYGYKDEDNSAAGISKIGYVSGKAGRGKADANGNNNAARGQTALPTGVVSLLSGNAAPTIQIVTSAGLCIGATMNAVNTDDGLRYQAQLR